MAKARAIVNRRKAVQNIRKITRTMELIATNRFKKALEPRDRGRGLHAEDRRAGRRPRRDVAGGHASAAWPREPVRRALLLVLTSNRGLAGGYNGNVLRAAIRAVSGQPDRGDRNVLEVAGKRGINYFRFRKIAPEATYTQFEDRPQYHEVEVLADRYIKLYIQGTIDRLDVVYTQFVTAARQVATVADPVADRDAPRSAGPARRSASPRSVDAEDDCGRRRRASRVPTSSCPTPEHPRGDRPGLVQGPAVQVLPGRGRQRADRADGRHGGATKNADDLDQGR